MVLEAAPDLLLEADLPLAEALFPFEEEADLPLAEDDLEANFDAPPDDLAEADFELPEVDLAEEGLLPEEADLLVPVAFLAVLPEDADLEALPALEVPAALVAVAFFAPVEADFEPEDLPAEADLEVADLLAEADLDAVDLEPAEVDFFGVEAADLVPVEAVFLAAEAEDFLAPVDADLLPADLEVVDFAVVDFAADLEVPEPDFAAVDLLPEVEDFFAVEPDFEAEDLVPPLTAFIALEAASSTAETAFFAVLAMLFNMPELFEAFVFFVEVAISFLGFCEVEYRAGNSHCSGPYGIQPAVTQRLNVCCYIEFYFINYFVYIFISILTDSVLCNRYFQTFCLIKIQF